MKKIILFGAQGLLGTEIFSAFAEQEKFTIIPLGSFNYDLARASEVERAFAELQPDIVINSAALTNVDVVENPRMHDLLYAVNTLAPTVMATEAQKCGAKFFQFSTDYVFDGTRGNYLESDKAQPVNAYGKSKLEAEVEILAANPAAIILRTARLFGQGGGNFVTHIRLDARKNRPLEAITDERGNFTYTRDIAVAMTEMVTESMSGGIYHLIGAEAASPFEVATEIVRLLKSRSHLTATIGTELERRAVRPKDTSLQSTKLPLLPGFRESLPLFLRCE